MAKFIEVNEGLSGASDELRYVNIEHIVMVRPRQNNEGSLIYLDKDIGNLLKSHFLGKVAFVVFGFHARLVVAVFHRA